jgi:hypothetical protein
MGRGQPCQAQLHRPFFALLLVALAGSGLSDANRHGLTYRHVFL